MEQAQAREGDLKGQDPGRVPIKAEGLKSIKARKGSTSQVKERKKSSKTAQSPGALGNGILFFDTNNQEKALKLSRQGKLFKSKTQALR